MLLIQAANNLIVLSREDAGAERIFQNNGVPLLLNMIETGKQEMILAAIRTLSGMCTGHKARVSIENESRQMHSKSKNAKCVDCSKHNQKCTSSTYMMLLEISLILKNVWEGARLFEVSMYIGTKITRKFL